MLDHDACERARVGRDAAFDGRFFTGVRTTRIYCRPVCPVRPARAENVGFTQARPQQRRPASGHACGAARKRRRSARHGKEAVRLSIEPPG
jgi:methylphosphotriester-DNA--protein-cysteine methyltransferase